jgi:hypothetical protein
MAGEVREPGPVGELDAHAQEAGGRRVAGLEQMLLVV